MNPKCQCGIGTRNRCCYARDGRRCIDRCLCILERCSNRLVEEIVDAEEITQHLVNNTIPVAMDPTLAAALASIANAQIGMQQALGPYGSGIPAQPGSRHCVWSQSLKKHLKVIFYLMKPKKRSILNGSHRYGASAWLKDGLKTKPGRWLCVPYGEMPLHGCWRWELVRRVIHDYVSLLPYRLNDVEEKSKVYVPLLIITSTLLDFSTLVFAAHTLLSKKENEDEKRFGAFSHIFYARIK